MTILAMKTLNRLIVDNREALLAKWSDMLRQAFSGAARKNPADLTSLEAVIDRLVDAFRNAASPATMNDPAFAVSGQIHDRCQRRAGPRRVYA